MGLEKKFDYSSHRDQLTHDLKSEENLEKRKEILDSEKDSQRYKTAERLHRAKVKKYTESIPTAELNEKSLKGCELLHDVPYELHNRFEMLSGDDRTYYLIKNEEYEYCPHEEESHYPPFSFNEYYSKSKIDGGAGLSEDVVKKIKQRTNITLDNYQGVMTSENNKEKYIAAAEYLSNSGRFLKSLDTYITSTSPYWHHKDIKFFTTKKAFMEFLKSDLDSINKMIKNKEFKDSKEENLWKWSMGKTKEMLDRLEEDQDDNEILTQKL
jgi:hypothetical protein